MIVELTLPSWCYIFAWLFLGYTLIIFNKLLLTTWGFHYPLFLTCWHCVFATVLTQILSRTTDWLPGVSSNKLDMQGYLRTIFPMACCFSVGLVSGNMAYQYISLSYIQMLKAFTPVPILLLSFMTGRESFSVSKVMIILLVSFGVMLASMGELHFDLVGFCLQILAMTADTTRMTILDLFLSDKNKLDALSLLYYMAPMSGLMIGICFYMVELPIFDWDMLTPSFMAILALNGLIAFSLNIAVYLLVGKTSAMVISICGPLKDITLIVTSLVVFKTPVTFLQVTGFSLSLVGIHLYKQLKEDADRFHQKLCGCLSKIKYMLGVDHAVGVDGAVTVLRPRFISDDVPTESFSSTSTKVAGIGDERGDGRGGIAGGTRDIGTGMMDNNEDDLMTELTALIGGGGDGNKA